MLEYTATQQRLVFVISAICWWFICLTRRRHFYWQTRCGFRRVRDVQCCKGILIVTPSPTASVFRNPLVEAVVTNEPKWSFNAGETKSLGHFRKFLTFSRPLIVTVRGREGDWSEVLYIRHADATVPVVDTYSFCFSIHIISVRKYETFWCNLDTRHCHTFTAGQPVNFSTNPLVSRLRELRGCVGSSYL